MLYEVITKPIEDGIRYQWEINMRPKGTSWQNNLLETQNIWAYKANSIVVATGIDLSHQSLLLNAGQTQVVTATLSPANATDKRIRWSSDNPLVAQVDINGKVTALSSGTATITAKAITGNVRASLLVNVSGAQLPDKAISIPGVIEAEKFIKTGGSISDNKVGLGVFREANRNNFV